MALVSRHGLVGRAIGMDIAQVNPGRPEYTAPAGAGI